MSTYYAGCAALIGAGIAAVILACTAPLPAEPPAPAPTVAVDEPRTITLDMILQQEGAPWHSAYVDGSLTACPTEDSEDCYWDAANMGNGTGASFLRWDGVTFFATGY